MSKFVYKHELAEQLGEAKVKLDNAKILLHDEVKEEVKAEYKEVLKSYDDVDSYDDAVKFLYSQPFATNCHGRIIIENLFCYRVDESGYWFSYNYIGKADKQTYNVRRSDLAKDEPNPWGDPTEIMGMDLTDYIRSYCDLDQTILLISEGDEDSDIKIEAREYCPYDFYSENFTPVVENVEYNDKEKLLVITYSMDIKY